MNITFRHAPLTGLQTYQAQFGSTPESNSTQDSISFPTLYPDLPLKGSASLHAKAEILLEARINRLQACQGIARNVEMLLRQTPGASMKELCLRLNIEPRTLQRKLKDAGTSLEVVQARIRHQRAAVMLLDPGLSIEVIALKLGLPIEIASPRPLHAGQARHRVNTEKGFPTDNKSLGKQPPSKLFLGNKYFRKNCTETLKRRRPAPTNPILRSGLLMHRPVLSEPAYRPKALLTSQAASRPLIVAATDRPKWRSITGFQGTRLKFTPSSSRANRPLASMMLRR